MDSIVIALYLMFFVGSISGGTAVYFLTRNHMEKKPKNEPEEILFDAKTNRELAQIYSNLKESPKQKVLNKISQKINRAALKGFTYLDMYSDPLNNSYANLLTREEIRAYLEPLGYEVIFQYEHIRDSSISEIRWDGGEKID